MPVNVRLASDYDHGAPVQYMLPRGSTFTQRLRITTGGRPSFLGLWLGNNQNPFGMRLRISVGDTPIFDQTFAGCHQRYSDWAVPFDLSSLTTHVNAGDWLTFEITPDQDIGFSPILVDSPDWPRDNLPGYGSVAARFFLDGEQPDPLPKLHGLAPLHFPGCSGDTHAAHPALLMFGLGDDNLPVVLNAMNGGWAAARIEAATEAMTFITPVMAADGSVHLFGSRTSDGVPVVACVRSADGVWQAGAPLPCDKPLSNVVAVIDNDRCTRVAALGPDGVPHVTAYNYWEQAWLEFYPIDVSVPMTSLTAVAAGDTVFLIGVDATDARARIACVLRGEVWARGGELAQGSAALASLTTARDGSGNTWAIGLGADHAAHIVAKMDAGGVWQPAASLVAPASLSAIAASTDSQENIYIVGIDAASHLPVMVLRFDNHSQQWGAAPGLPAQTKAVSALWLLPGDTADLVLIGANADDGQPFIAASLNSNGVWI